MRSLYDVCLASCRVVASEELVFMLPLVRYALDDAASHDRADRSWVTVRMLWTWSEAPDIHWGAIEVSLMIQMNLDQVS